MQIDSTIPNTLFTIIIPTFERHFLLRRSIDYYKKFNCNIIIADSSAKKMHYTFPDNIVYMHLPSLSFARKILLAAETITTPYVCISSDDDYLIESSLRTGACFLDSNLDYVSVQGGYLKFELIDNEIVFSPRYAPEASYYSVKNKDIFSRVVKSCGNNMHQILSLHRKDAFIGSYRASSDISSISMIEITASFVPMCYGKHTTLPLLWMARESARFPRPNAYYRETTLEKSEHILFSSYKGFQNHLHEIHVFLDSEESQSFKKRLGTEVSKLVSDGKEIDKIFNAAFNSLTKSLRSHRIKVMLKVIIKLFIPDRALNYLKTRKKNQNMSSVDKKFCSNGSLNKIRLSVLSFPEVYNNTR